MRLTISTCWRINIIYLRLLYFRTLKKSHKNVILCEWDEINNALCQILCK
jgi:hypothetical protein